MPARCSRRRWPQRTAIAPQRERRRHGCSRSRTTRSPTASAGGQVEARARRRVGIRDAIEYSTGDLERIEARASESDWATQLLGTLPVEQQEAVRARIIEERPYPEIARELSTSALVVRKRVSRGLATLREHLEEPT